MERKPIVEMDCITKTFGAIVALNNVSVDFLPGEVHSVVGENGAGKSTLIKILTGYHTDYEGRVAIRGNTVRFQSPREALQAGIGCVYQERNLIPGLSVAENVFLGRMPRGFLGCVDWKSTYGRANQELQQLGMADLDPTQKVEAYPQGLRQMAEIARILFSGAEVIVLDEPTTALSTAERQKLFELLSTLKSQDKCIIYISHFLEDVLDVSDRITILKDGEKVDTFAKRDLDKETIVRLMSRQFVKSVSPVKRRKTGDAADKDIVVQARDLTIRGHVYDVSFRLARGEALGLHGNVGCGSVAFVEGIFGLRKFDRGQLLLENRPIHGISPAQASRMGIGFVPEERRDVVWHGQNLVWNLTLAHLSKLSRFWTNRASELAAAMRIIQMMDVLPPLPSMPVEWLSGGNQQKVVVGRWLVELPKLLIVCEPANGMDVGAKANIIQKLWQIKEQGVAIIVVSTDPEVIIETCDRSLVFQRGRVSAELETDSLTKEGLALYG